MSDYGYSVEVPHDYDEAVVRTRMAFRGEGFSVITEAHVGGMLDPEAGDDRQYLIMGVWSPTVSQRQIGNDLEVGVHLPCNVVVQETGSTAIVAALDPAEDYDEAAVPAQIADAARDALTRVLEKVSADG